MKKSYLALGLVAVALSSCSSDKIDAPSVGNESNATKGLEPVVLSMSSSIADVQVGTRGTGTVGDTATAKNVWQYEDIYVLMTSSDAECLDSIQGAEGKYQPSWDFTSVMGVGPFLKQQFDGKFWARPVQDEVSKKWKLDYTIDENEWWCHLPIDKFYPMKGKSQFFAFYIDDACSKVTRNPYAGDAGIDGTHTQSFTHDHPVYTFDKDSTYMTVDFKINGTQDLMAGTADQSKTYEGLGFSAQSARAGIVPSIVMNHLLSRFTFNVKWGAESAKMVQIDSIRVQSESTGNMKVAYSNEYAAAMAQAQDTIEILSWTEKQNKVDFKLHEQVKVLSVDKDGYLLNAEGKQITVQDYEYTYNEETSTWEESAEKKPYALKTVPAANGAIKYLYNNGKENVIKDAVEGLCYVSTPASLENGKALLQPLTSFLMVDAFANLDKEKDLYRVGEAMFVKPGEKEYQMFVDMTMYIREEATEPKVEDEEGNVTDHVHGALTENITLPLTLSLGDNKVFEAGKSYNINITIYGLEKVEVEIELTEWEDGGDINVGADTEYPKEEEEEGI